MSRDAQCGGEEDGGRLQKGEEYALTELLETVLQAASLCGEEWLKFYT